MNGWLRRWLDDARPRSTRQEFPRWAVPLAATLATLVLPTVAVAQDETPRYHPYWMSYEVFGSVGAGKVSEDEGGSAGSGLDFTAGFAHRSSPRVAFEVEVSRMGIDLDSRLGRSTFVRDGHAIAVSGHVVFLASADRPAQPFVSVGAGVLRQSVDFRGSRPIFDRETWEQTGVERFSGNQSDSGAFLRLGAGFKAFVTPSLSVRGEGKILVGGVASTPYWMRGTVGLAYHW